MAKRRKGPELCPCGSVKLFAACCGRYLDDVERAPTPEALMRSRYTAYALGRDDYVLSTWHESTRPATLFAPGEPRPKWVGLTVESAETHGSEGTVRFVAKARTSAGAMTLTETSRFVNEAGRWYYVDGELD